MEGTMPGIECQVCRNHFKVGEVIKAKLVEEPLAQLIREKHPKWSPRGFICLADLNLFRTRYVTEVLKSASQEVFDLEQGMAKSLEEEEVLSRNINQEFEDSFTLGQRLADRIAAFGGSWTFISIFMVVLVVWMASIPGFSWRSLSIPILTSCSTWCSPAWRPFRPRLF